MIDHSVQVDHFGGVDAFDLNAPSDSSGIANAILLRWGQTAFRNFRWCRQTESSPGEPGISGAGGVPQSGSMVYPDSVVGTDSHTTMINGLGVLGWGVGGIEAEVCMLGQPVHAAAAGGRF